jgi:deoxyribonuclease V
MKIPPVPHKWTVTPRQAIAIQKQLASRVVKSRPRKAIRFVAGADAAFPKGGKQVVAAVVLWDLEQRIVLEEHVAVRKLTFPYVPGLLSFREAPAVLAALRKLRQNPDCLMMDGHGLAHPRRFGIACHVGVICRTPTIGCAKSRLTGFHDEPDLARGSWTPLEDHAVTLGTVLRTRDGVKPVFVSVGHRIDLGTAEQVVLDCAVRYRLPEPTRLADRLVAAAKRKVEKRQA